MTTAEHPFYTAEGEWVEASELEAGDEIRTAAWTAGVVESVYEVTRPEAMYNFTVGVAHTYFVGETEWLVHNSNKKDCIDWNKVKENAQMRRELILFARQSGPGACFVCGGLANSDPRLNDDLILLTSSAPGIEIRGMNGEPIDGDNGWHILMIDKITDEAWDVTKLEALGPTRLVLHRFKSSNPGMKVQRFTDGNDANRAINDFYGQ